MTKSENLLERITRIAETGTIYKQGRRVLTDGNNNAILPAMLQEIDETILARELTFHSDTGNRIALIAKGRRLWRISEVEPKSLLPKGADLVSVNLSGDDDATMSTLTKLMHNFAETAKTLSVSIANTEPDSDYTAMGISVRVLHGTWNVAAAPASPSNSLLGFVETFSNEILASVIMAGDEIISTSGSNRQIKLLTGLIKDQLSDIDTEFRKLKKNATPKSLIALNRDSKSFIVCARMEDQTALIICKPDKAPDIVSTWQQLN